MVEKEAARSRPQTERPLHVTKGTVIHVPAPARTRKEPFQESSEWSCWSASSHDVNLTGAIDCSAVRALAPITADLKGLKELIARAENGTGFRKTSSV